MGGGAGGRGGGGGGGGGRLRALFKYWTLHGEDRSSLTLSSAHAPEGL